MLTRVYDTSLCVNIVLNDMTEFSQVFDSSWCIRDALSWMYDTYLIDDDKIIEQTCSFVKRYKLKNDKKD